LQCRGGACSRSGVGSRRLASPVPGSNRRSGTPSARRASGHPRLRDQPRDAAARATGTLAEAEPSLRRALTGREAESGRSGPASFRLDQRAASASDQWTKYRCKRCSCQFSELAKAIFKESLYRVNISNHFPSNTRTSSCVLRLTFFN